MSQQKVCALCVILSITIFIVDLSIPLGVAVGVPYIVVILAALWSPRRRLIWYMATGTSVLTIIGFFSSPAGGELWKVLFNRSIALFAIWATAILSVQRQTIQKEKEKAISELRVLSGLLPVCASCKKIRDDKGSWSQMEMYLKDHSEATFSHGYCPECEKKALAEINEMTAEE